MDISLENSLVKLIISLTGGAFIDFHFKDHPINPINFQDTGNPSFHGHFLCFDRWGLPTEAEKANGFVPHGEVNTQEWVLLEKVRKEGGSIGLSMRCKLPMGGLQLIRTVELYENQPVFRVTEEIKNMNKYGRMFNIVQHATISPPFLDTETLIDNNTDMGFENRFDGSMDQDDIVFKWPEANLKGEIISLRQLQNEWPCVSSFVFSPNSKYGWVTASNPTKKLMLGYIWETKDYPWINFWRSMKDGKPSSYGMEFGTTGLHEPYPVLAKKGRIFDKNIFAFIDANEVISKSYTAFLSKIPANYQGVLDIEIKDTFIVIKEKNGQQDIVCRLK